MTEKLVTWMDASGNIRKTRVEVTGEAIAEDIVERSNQKSNSLPGKHWERHISTIKI